MSARNQDTLEVSAPNSNKRTREQRKGENPSKPHGMTPPNRKRKRSNKKWQALEDDNEVSSTSYSSFDDDCNDYCDDDDDDDNDESSIVSKLMLKHELISLTKEFENLKNEFSILVKINNNLVCDLENSNFLKDQLKKANDEIKSFLRIY